MPWAVGTVLKKSTAKRTHGQFEVDYGREFKPNNIYKHELKAADHGPNKTWCHVKRAE